MSELTPKCPTCGARVGASEDVPSFPFCSRRCKLVDLGNWLEARYVVRDGLAFDNGSGRGSVVPTDGE